MRYMPVEPRIQPLHLLRQRAGPCIDYLDELSMYWYQQGYDLVVRAMRRRGTAVHRALIGRAGTDPIRARSGPGPAGRQRPCPRRV